LEWEMVKFGCCIGGISPYICPGVLTRCESVGLAAAYHDILKRLVLRVAGGIGFQCHCLAKIVPLRCLCSLHRRIIWGTATAEGDHSRHQTRITLWFRSHLA
jgi:hypothetical protein